MGERTRPLAAGALAVMLSLGAAAAAGAERPWAPDRPITIVVPWAAGGATDQVARLTAGEIGQALGQQVVVVNRPGAAGATGTREVLEAPHDGYVWAAGAAKQLGTYKLLGLLDTVISDWRLYLTVTNLPVVSVHPDAPYADIDALFKAMRSRPGRISVATAGPTSAGHLAMEAIRLAVPGIGYKHVTYDGGSLAVLGTAAGETLVTTQLACEQAGLIRRGRLRPLAAVSHQPVEIEGYGEIPPLTGWIKDVASAGTHFGIFVPKGVPKAVLETFDAIWTTRIRHSRALRAYAKARGALFTPVHGAAAVAAIMPEIRADAWMLYEAGRIKASPAELGIARPDG